MTEQSKEALTNAIKARIENVLNGPLAKDSPLFQLFDEFPGIQMSHEVTDVFRERVEYSEEFKDRLEDARMAGSKEQVLTEIKVIQSELGNLNPSS